MSTDERIEPPILFEVAAEGGQDIGKAFVDQIRQSRDEVLELHGKGDLSHYEQLFRDDQVKSTFDQRRANVIGRETRVEPGGPSDLDKMAADFLREQLGRIAWDRTTKKMLSGLMYGYGVGECMWGQRGFQITLESIKVRRAKRFRFMQDGALALMRKDKPEVLPGRKFWTFTAGAEDDDDPYGLGLGHWLHWPVWFKRNVIRFWAIFVERFSMATVIAKAGNLTDEQRSELLDLLSAVTGGGRIVLPKGVDIELAQSMKDSGGDYAKFVDLMNASISKINVGQTMTTDDGASLSQSEVHERVGTFTARDDDGILSDSFMQGPARWLTEWNFPGAETPRVYRDFGIAADLAATAQRDVSLNTIGYKPTPARVLEVYGEGYEPFTPPVASAGPAFAESSPLGTGDAVSDLLEGNGWQRAMGPEVGRIEQLTENCRTLEEVRDRLGEIAMHDPAQLTDAMSRIMFAARLAGNASAEPDDEGGAK